MSRYFDFSYDPATRFLRLKLSDVWHAAALESFVAAMEEIRSQALRAGRVTRSGRILIDLTDFAVQPKDITADISRLLPELGALADRVAIVRSGSALQHLQTQRLIDMARVRVFGNAPDAEDWLKSA